MVNKMAPIKNITRHDNFNRSVIAGNVKREAKSNVARKSKKFIGFFLYVFKILKAILWINT